MNDAEKIYELVRWWEKRRWIYNLIMLLIGGWLTWGTYAHYIYQYPLRFAFEIVFFGIMANLAYTLGWIFPIITASFRKNMKGLGASRNILFVWGLLFSLLIVFGYIALTALGFSAQ